MSALVKQWVHGNVLGFGSAPACGATVLVPGTVGSGAVSAEFCSVFCCEFDSRGGQCPEHLECFKEGNGFPPIGAMHGC